MNGTRHEIAADTLKVALTRAIKTPACFGTSDVENLDGQYKGKCLICGIEDKCIGAYLRHVADKEEKRKQDVVFRAPNGKIIVLDPDAYSLVKLLYSRLEDLEYLTSLRRKTEEET